jgi:DNA-binding transcriptional MocR family regulator
MTVSIDMSAYHYRLCKRSILSACDHIGSFSKLLPSLRLSYLIVPPDLVDPFAAATGIRLLPTIRNQL